MKKRSTAILLIMCMMAALLTGCGSSGKDNGTASSSSVKGDELKLCLASPPETIDPTMGSALDSSCYNIHNFEGLMRYKWDGSGVEAGMAESYDVSDDGLVWTFHLRDSKWSDGEPVKAQDFEYSWKRLANPDTAAPYAYDMAVYVKNGTAILDGEKALDEFGVKVIDDKTFEVTLENACPYFAEIVAFPVFMPLRQDVIESAGADDWVKDPKTYISNGPFKMESFSLDENMVTVPNPGYWDAASVKPAKITWVFLADNKAELAAFRAGEVDFIDQMPEEDIPALQTEGTHGNIPQLGTYYISFNTAKEPFNDPLVRKALTLAVDTQYIADVIKQGRVAPGEAFVGTGFKTAGQDELFRDNWQTYVAPADYEKNKEAAQAALAEAGYPGGAGFPKSEYLLNNDTAHVAIAEALQNMWKEVLGINVEIRATEWATVTSDRRAGNFNIARNGWIGDYNDPATMLTLFLSTSGNNDGKYSNPAYDEKIAASMAESDPVKRNTLLHEAEDILMGEDFACAPIYYYTDDYAVVTNLKNWGITPLGYKFFAGAYFE